MGITAGRDKTWYSPQSSINISKYLQWRGILKPRELKRIHIWCCVSWTITQDLGTHMIFSYWDVKLKNVPLVSFRISIHVHFHLLLLYNCYSNIKSVYGRNFKAGVIIMSPRNWQGSYVCDTTTLWLPGCLSKARTMTKAIDMLTWKGKISWDPTPRQRFTDS